MRKYFRIIFCCYYVVFVVTVDGFWAKPAFGINVSEEEELSQEFMKIVAQRFEIIKDSIISRYVESVGKRILEVMPHQPFSYHFYVVRKDVYNAFAGPAGHIFINSGLLEAMENEEELAGILSHEIAHAACRHISQQIERSKKITLATLAGIAAGIFLGVGGAGPSAVNALTMGSVAAGQSVSLAYSREDEMQADQIGLKYLAEAGYGGSGLLSMLKKIRNKQWVGPDEMPTYLTTHPALEDRLAYVGAWVEERGGIQAPTEMNPGGFVKAHTRLIALYGDESSTRKILEADIHQYPENPIGHYGYGLFLARIGNRNEAEMHLKTALGKRVFDSDILGDLGRIYFLDGRYADALKTLKGSVGLSPEHRESLFWLGRTQISLEYYAEATATLEMLISVYPDCEDAYYFIGEAYGKCGRTSDAHYYLGTYYKMKGDKKLADFHLRRAVRKGDQSGSDTDVNEMLNDIRRQESSKK